MDESSIMTIEEVDKTMEELSKDLVYFRQLGFLSLYSKLDKYRRALHTLREIIKNTEINNTQKDIKEME